MQTVDALGKFDARQILGTRFEDDMMTRKLNSDGESTRSGASQISELDFEAQVPEDLDAAQQAKGPQEGTGEDLSKTLPSSCEYTACYSIDYAERYMALAAQYGLKLGRRSREW